MAWETITKRGYSGSNTVPMVGVRKHGISVNSVAARVMGLESKDGIELLHDKDNSMIGLRKIKSPEATDFIVRQTVGAKDSGRGSCFISSSAFCSRLDKTQYGSFELKFNKSDDIWYVDLTDHFVAQY